MLERLCGMAIAVTIAVDLGVATGAPQALP